MKQKTRIIIYIAIAITALTLGIIAVLSMPKEASSKTADEFINAGNKYLLELSYDKAVIEFNKAIEIEPRNADAYIGLAEAYLGMGDKDKAIETLELGYENTGDERIKEMLDELIGVVEETTVVTTTVTSSETTTTETTMKDFSQDPTVDFYLPSKLTVYSKFHFNHDYCYDFSVEIHNNGYDFYVSNDFDDSISKINGDTLVISNPDVYCSFNGNEYYSISILDESYLDWCEHPIDLDYYLSGQHFFDNWDGCDDDNLVKKINNSLHSMSSVGKGFYKDETEIVYSFSDLAEVVLNDGRWSFEYEDGKVIKITDNEHRDYQLYEYDSNGYNVAIIKYDHFTEFEGKVTYRYDSLGNLINRTVYNSSNEIIENVDIEYTVLQISENCILPFEEEFGFKFNR